MTDRTFEVPVVMLEAAMTHAAKDDVRYYLNGVYLDTVAGRICATDGHRLLLIPCPGIRDGGPGVILPREACEFVRATYRKLSKRERATFLAVSVTCGADFAVTVRFATGQSFGTKAIDGRFPDYERVIPRELSGKPAQYNPEYLLAASDALALLVGSNHPASVYHNGKGGDSRVESACIVQHASGPALAVVMPMRMDTDNGPDLSWLDATPAESEAA